MLKYLPYRSFVMPECTIMGADIESDVTAAQRFFEAVEDINKMASDFVRPRIEPQTFLVYVCLYDNNGTPTEEERVPAVNPRTDPRCRLRELCQHYSLDRGLRGLYTKMSMYDRQAAVLDFTVRYRHRDDTVSICLGYFELPRVIRRFGSLTAAHAAQTNLQHVFGSLRNNACRHFFLPPEISLYT